MIHDASIQVTSAKHAKGRGRQPAAVSGNAPENARYGRVFFLHGSRHIIKH